MSSRPLDLCRALARAYGAARGLKAGVDCRRWVSSRIITVEVQAEREPGRAIAVCGGIGPDLDRAAECCLADFFRSEPLRQIVSSREELELICAAFGGGA